MDLPPLTFTPALLESITEGVVLVDAAYRYVYANAAALRLLQKPPEALLGLRMWDVFPDAPPHFREPVDRAMAEQTSTEVVALNVRRNTWYDVRCYPYEGGLVMIFRDVSAQQRMEQALAESEARFRTMADAAPVLIWTAGLDKRCSYVNRTWEAFTGRTLEEELDHGWLDGVHPDDRALCTRVFDEAFEARRPYELESRLRRHDGTYRWVLDHGTPRFSPDGAFTGFIGAVTDVHDRRAEATRRAFLDRASRTLASSLDYDATLKQVAALAVPEIAAWCSVTLVGADRRLDRVAVAHADPAMLEQVRDYERRYPPDPEGSEVNAQVIRTGEPVVINDITDAMLVAAVQDPEQLAFIRSLGMRALLVVPIKAGNEVLGIISLVQTEPGEQFDADAIAFAGELATRAALAIQNARLYAAAHEAEARLREANEALEERVQERTAQLEETVQALGRSNRELQSFAQVASHDLQEPLRKVRAFAGLLAQEFGANLGETGQHYVERLQQAAARMSQFVTDLLTYARVETAQEAFQPVDLDATLTAVLSDLDMRIAESGGRVEADALPVVLADVVQMRQLLLNLIGNALKYHRPDTPPVVRVSAREEAQRVWLMVEDNGIGFEPRFAERIFAPFQRLHSRSAFEGTGMGLSIVRRIAERHGGTVSADSTPGMGSRFLVSLARRPQPSAPVQEG